MTHPLPSDTTEDARRIGARVAVLPIGSFEQHGPHLPLATDTIVACAIADRIAAAHPVLRLPPLTISCSHEHAAWPGTVSISAATLHAVVRDIADSMHRSGVPNLVLVNAHGGNYVLRNVVQEASVTDRRMALFPDARHWRTATAAAGIQTSTSSDMHAGEIETSILLHTDPTAVRPGYDTADRVADDREHLLTLGLTAYTDNGVIGRPALADAAKGQALLAGLVAAFAGVLRLFGELETGIGGLRGAAEQHHGDAG